MHPAMIRLRGVRPEIDGKLGLDAQQIAPFHRQIIGIFVARQQPVNQRAPFVRIAVQNKFLRLQPPWATCRSRPDKRAGQTPDRSKAAPGRCAIPEAAQKQFRQFYSAASAGPGFQTAWRRKRFPGRQKTAAPASSGLRAAILPARGFIKSPDDKVASKASEKLTHILSF